MTGALRHEVSERTIRAFFPETDFTSGPVLPLRIANNAGGLTANMVILWKKD